MPGFLIGLDVTCASTGSSAGRGTKIACRIDYATLKGYADEHTEKPRLDMTMLELESWVRGTTVEFVQRDDGLIQGVPEVRWNPAAEPLPRYRTDWLGTALSACLESLNVEISLEATHWRTSTPNGSIEVHVEVRTDDVLIFADDGTNRRIAVQFDRRKRAIEKSHMYYPAILGGPGTYNGSRDFTSEILYLPDPATAQ
jgi:hypothetical protein